LFLPDLEGFINLCVLLFLFFCFRRFWRYGFFRLRGLLDFFLLDDFIWLIRFGDFFGLWLFERRLGDLRVARLGRFGRWLFLLAVLGLFVEFQTDDQRHAFGLDSVGHLPGFFP